MQKTKLDLASETYEKALERERIRERDYRRTKQGAFESSFIHPSQLHQDEGLPARAIGTLADAITPGPEDFSPKVVAGRKAKLDYACQKLRRHGRGHLVYTLQLIAKNGKNKKESIWELSRKAKRTTRQKTDTTET